MILEIIKSAKNITIAVIIIAINIAITADCVSFLEGVVTVFISLKASLINEIIIFKMAGARGIEPPTNGFGDRYSTS